MTDNNVKPAKKVRLTFTKGVPQLLALVAILLIDSMVAPNFFSLHIQDGQDRKSVV